ncbi:PilW family protein [Desulfobotulus sp. H1]|uniref:PilW family protein n=1 Tax=Desulfobotulus pelophilus TaxID=2823377 RepID=A0ABT3NCS0_9BACT|nr:PilW family protein [Desulfobotulus pelophilus]MCW7755246.1 PilW family protein [Desulfobotulus pelophilus]
MKKEVVRVWKSRSGITLVELLVTLAVAMLLGTGIYQVFAGTVRSYSTNEALARLQEDGRMALAFLRSEIQGAGYLGCLSDPDTVESGLNNPDFFAVNFTRGIYGLEASAENTWRDSAGEVSPTATGLNAMALDPPPLTGSDILVIRGMLPIGQPMTLTGSMDSDGNFTVDSLPEGLLQEDGGDILMVADCHTAVIFQTTSCSDTGVIARGPTSDLVPGNASVPLAGGFSTGAEVFVPQTQIFYVANDPITNIPSLFSMSRPTRSLADLVISGVDNFQVRYGVDTNGDGMVNGYVNANAVTDWGRVLSVRFGLLLRTPLISDPNAPADAGTYDVSGNGATDFTAPGDRRMRMVFSGTVGLRNRIR